MVISTLFKQVRLFCTKNEPNEALKLYKHLMRQCQKLPKGPREHYRYTIKQSFIQFVNESDPQRIKEIIEKSYEDCKWILNKYLKK